jgi:heptosyltransferase I
MKRILVVKVTSLGDVIQAQSVVSDLQTAFPGVEIDWAVDEAFADILRWNKGISRVLCAPLRQFKRSRSMKDFLAICRSIKDLRRERYDAVFDLHGVYKSAIISFLARAKRRYGYAKVNLGENGAAFAYSHRFAPRHDANAWEGMRRALSDTLGYSLAPVGSIVMSVPDSDSAPDFGEGAPYALLFHATSKAEKKWPQANWIAVAQSLIAEGLTPLLPWGSDIERQEAEAIAQGVPGARVLPKLSITEIAQCIQRAALVIGTDTGLVHLASALRRPTVMIFSATSRPLFGIDVPGLCVSIGDNGKPPSVGEALSAAAFVRNPT